MSLRKIDEYPDYPKHYAKFKAKGFENDVSVEYTIHCPKCGSDWLIKASKDSNSDQRMKCKRCNYRFRFSMHWNETARILQALVMFKKGQSVKMIAKDLGIDTSTVTEYIENYHSTACPLLKDIIDRQD